MDLSPSFVASLIGRPADEFQYVETIGQFLSLGLCPVGLERPALALGVQAANVCRNSLGDSSHPELAAHQLPAAQVKRRLLQRVQARMLTSRARGRLAGLLANASVMRVGEEIDRLYEDLQLAGMALPTIVGPTFEVGANGAGGTFEAACYVSLSTDDPDEFDVVIGSPRGLAEPHVLPPENALRLFLFSRDTVVNPRPRQLAARVL